MSDAVPIIDGPAQREPLVDDVAEIIRLLGEDAQREGLLLTPQRVADSLRYLTSGYAQSVEDVVHGAVFAEDYEEMVLVKDIELYSLCEHHMLPFFGKAHVAYLPRGRILGLSKVARLVDVFARRLQVQERLTTQVAEAIDDALQPYGVAVVIEAAHLCMMMRGIQKQNSKTLTSCMLGSFRDDEKSRAEFLELIRR
jgi:GTP cyclohydrolase I